MASSILCVLTLLYLDVISEASVRVIRLIQSGSVEPWHGWGCCCRNSLEVSHTPSVDASFDATCCFEVALGNAGKECNPSHGLKLLPRPYTCPGAKKSPIAWLPPVARDVFGCDVGNHDCMDVPSESCNGTILSGCMSSFQMRKHCKAEWTECVSHPACRALIPSFAFSSSSPLKGASQIASFRALSTCVTQNPHVREQLALESLLRICSRVSHACRDVAFEQTSFLSKEDRTKLNISNFRGAAEKLAECGVVWLRDVVPTEVVDQASADLFEHWPKIGKLSQQEASLIGVHWRGANDEGEPNRWEITVPTREPYFNEDFIDNSIIRQLLATYNKQNPFVPFEQLELTHASLTLTHTMSKGDYVRFHVDEDFRGVPSWGSVAFIPLLDMNVDDGPSCFLLGSHLHSASIFPTPSDDVMSFDGTLKPIMLPLLAPIPQRGDVLIMDGQVWHEALPNVGGRYRALLYYAYYRRGLVDSNVNNSASPDWGTSKSAKVEL